MKRKNWKSYAFWILLAEGVGALAGWLTREGARLYSQSLRKPPLSPPAIVFPMVWAALYALMGVSAARVAQAPRSPARTQGLDLHLIQLAVNFFWSIFFFNFRAYGFSLLWLALLWGLILAMILRYRQVDVLAARLQLPYLIWVAFAGYLNAGVWLLNP